MDVVKLARPSSSPAPSSPPTQVSRGQGSGYQSQPTERHSNNTGQPQGDGAKVRLNIDRNITEEA